MSTASATRTAENTERLLPDFGRFWKLLPETLRSHPGWSCRHSDHIPRQICQRLLVNYTTCHWVAMDSAVSFPYLGNTKIASICFHFRNWYLKKTILSQFARYKKREEYACTKATPSNNYFVDHHKGKHFQISALLIYIRVFQNPQKVLYKLQEFNIQASFIMAIDNNHFI